MGRSLDASPPIRLRAVAATAAAAAFACGVGCSPAPLEPEPGLTVTQAAPSPAAAPSEPYSVTLPGEAAASFETRPPIPSPLVAEVTGRFPDLQHEPCLERAARAHADLPDGFEDHVPLAFTEFALHWAGCPDPTATLSVLLTNQTGIEPLLDELADVLPQLDATHFGIGASPARPPYATRWFVLLIERHMSMKPVPTAAEPGSTLPLQFRLDRQFTRATVAVTTPRGRTEVFEAGVSGGVVVAGVAVGPEVGRQWVELIGHGRAGPRVLALFPVEVGRPPPRRWIGSPAADESWIDGVDDAEALAARLVREDRSRFGLPELRLDPQLSAIAREHSREMADEGYFAHVSPRTGSVADRLRAAGYEADFAAENIAMAPTIAQAQESLMRSPGHRAAVLLPDATDFGVGVVFRDDERRGVVHHVTQIFVRRSPAAQPL